MSDTPRVDACRDRLTSTMTCLTYVSIDFARELERENAKLSAIIMASRDHDNAFEKQIEHLTAANAKMHEALNRIYTLPVSERKWSTAMDIAATALNIV